MNKKRRSEIARATALIEQAWLILETCRDEEQDYYDNMPESFQDGEKGEAAQTAIDALDEAVSALEDMKSTLDDISSQ